MAAQRDAMSTESILLLTDTRQYICLVVRDTVDLAVVCCALAVSTDRVCRERAKSGSGSGGDRARVFDVRGVVLVGGLCEGGVRPRLVQVDVGDVQTYVVFSLQAGQDGGDSRHQRGKTGPQLWIRVPALEHDAIPAKTWTECVSEQEEVGQLFMYEYWQESQQSILTHFTKYLCFLSEVTSKSSWCCVFCLRATGSFRPYTATVHPQKCFCLLCLIKPLLRTVWACGHSA